MTVSLELVNDVIGRPLKTVKFTFTKRDTIIYALGVGAPANWLDPDELKFVYEFYPDFVALPTMPAIYGSELILETLKGDFHGIKFNPMMLVHGDEALEIKKTLPVEGTITCTSKIRDIFDKGSGMLIYTDLSCVDENGDELAIVSSSMFIRGLGGFGGERGTSEKVEMPERAPDVVHEEQTLEKQALVYRLSGDTNPLHADPKMAQVGNFKTPILHGLATYGFAGRAVLKHFAGNDPSRFKSMSGRFSKEVYPGETLITEMWESDDCVLFQMKAKERDVVVLSGGKVGIS